MLVRHGSNDETASPHAQRGNLAMPIDLRPPDKPPEPEPEPDSTWKLLTGFLIALGVVVAYEVWQRF